MRETRILEFKETITNTFLKTVSAFANYNGGTILFGVDDNGNVKGVPDVKLACLSIENKINDSISPQPKGFIAQMEVLGVQAAIYYVPFWKEDEIDIPFAIIPIEKLKEEYVYI